MSDSECCWNLTTGLLICHLLLQFLPQPNSIVPLDDLHPWIAEPESKGAPPGELKPSLKSPLTKTSSFPHSPLLTNSTLSIWTFFPAKFRMFSPTFASTLNLTAFVQQSLATISANWTPFQETTKWFLQRGRPSLAAQSNLSTKFFDQLPCWVSVRQFKATRKAANRST